MLDTFTPEFMSALEPSLAQSLLTAVIKRVEGYEEHVRASVKQVTLSDSTRLACIISFKWSKFLTPAWNFEICSEVKVLPPQAMFFQSAAVMRPVLIALLTGKESGAVVTFCLEIAAVLVGLRVRQIYPSHWEEANLPKSINLLNDCPLEKKNV